MKIDLTPRERYLARNLEWWQFLLICISVAAVILAGAQTYFHYIETEEIRASLGQTESLIKSLRPQEAEARAIQQEIDVMTAELRVLRQQMEAQVPWDRVLAEVSGRVPQNAQLSSVSASANGQIVINAVTFMHEDAAQTAVALRNSPMFTSVEVVSSNFDEGRSPGVRFTVHLQLSDISNR